MMQLTPNLHAALISAKANRPSDKPEEDPVEVVKALSSLKVVRGEVVVQKRNK